MIDAQAGDDGWIVPVAVTAALMEDRDAARAAESALAPLAERPAHRAPDNPLWRRAARDALTDPALHQAATACFAAAEDALPRLGAGAAIRADVPPTICSTSTAPHPRPRAAPGPRFGVRTPPRAC